PCPYGHITSDLAQTVSSKPTDSQPISSFLLHDHVPSERMVIFFPLARWISRLAFRPAGLFGAGAGALVPLMARTFLPGLISFSTENSRPVFQLAWLPSFLPLR